jgi:trk system potassium uptake protein TrkA
MNFIVVGCGRVGAELAERLSRNGHRVTVVDQTGANFSNLSPDFRGRTIEGEVLNEDVLRRAGIEEADGFATVTNSDTLNAVAAYIARTIFNIENVVVRNYDPNYRPVLETFGLQIVGSSSWGAQRIEDLLYQTETRVVFSPGDGDVSLYEFVVPESWGAQPAGALFNGDHVLAAVTRAGQSLLPNHTTQLQAGDVLLVSATRQGSENLRRKLYERQEA